MTLRDVCSQWRKHSQLLADSDFPLVEPILAVRSVAQQTLMSRMVDPNSTQYISSVLTDHLMELCQLARKAGNTQVGSECVRSNHSSMLENGKLITMSNNFVQLAERAVYQMKLHGGGGASGSSPVSSWQLEEAQVFWAKEERGLALDLLKQMIHNLDEKVRNKHIHVVH